MTEIRTILFASDLSPESDRAFEHARFLAERFGARLTIYHALEMPRIEYAGWVDADDDRRARWERKVREELSRRASGLTVPHEFVVQGPVVGGHFLVDLALLDVIHRTRPDVTVMATRGRKGFASFFLGSVTEQVVQHAGLPVLCVRKSAHGFVLPYQRLLVPTDFSPASRRAFPFAALMARSFEAKLTALHVAPAPTLAVLTGIPDAPLPRVPTEEEVRGFLQPDFAAIAFGAAAATLERPWPTTDAAAFSAFLAENRGAILAQSMLFVVGAGAYLWFLGSLRSFLMKDEGGTGRLSNVAFGAGIIWAGINVVGQAPQIALTLPSEVGMRPDLACSQISCS